jgi:hypothetical protein
MLQTELPTFDAHWWPVMLETVPGSGERITIGHVVRAGSGQSHARQGVPPAVLSAMFGEAGKSMLMVVVQAVTALQTQLDAGVRVEELSMPFGGMALGQPRDCLAHDLNEVFDVAARLGGAFSASQFGVSEKSITESERAFDEWAERVRIQLLQTEFDFVERKRSKVGFVYGDYAANFGVLRPGKSTSTDSRALKVKIFDLEVLRRQQGLIVHRAEVIVGCPDWSSNTVFSRREADGLRSSWEFIAHEAKQRSITAVRCSGALDAAKHLRAAAA